jgi:hypothetical protein
MRVGKLLGVSDTIIIQPRSHLPQSALWLADEECSVNAVVRSSTTSQDLVESNNLGNNMSLEGSCATSRHIQAVQRQWQPYLLDPTAPPHSEEFAALSVRLHEFQEASASPDVVEDLVAVAEAMRRYPTIEKEFGSVLAEMLRK